MKKIVRYNTSLDRSPVYGSLGMGVVDHNSAIEFTVSTIGTWVLYSDIKEILPESIDIVIDRYNISVGRSPVYGSLGMGVVGHKDAVEAIKFKEGKWVQYLDFIEFLSKTSDTE
jgi:hypothetical protein